MLFWASFAAWVVRLSIRFLVDGHHAHPAAFGRSLLLVFGLVVVMLCLAACSGMGFYMMWRAKPEWLRHTPFVLGAMVVVMCSVLGAVVIFTHRGEHAGFAWFLTPILPIDILLGVRMMWWNGQGRSWRPGARLSAGG